MSKLYEDFTKLELLTLESDINKRYNELKLLSDHLELSQVELKQKLQMFDVHVKLLADRNIEFPIDVDLAIRTIKQEILTYTEYSQILNSNYTENAYKLPSLFALKVSLERLQQTIDSCKDHTSNSVGISNYIISKFNELYATFISTNKHFIDKSIVSYLKTEMVRLPKLIDEQIKKLESIVTAHAKQQKVPVDIHTTLLTMVEQLNNLTLKVTALENKFGQTDTRDLKTAAETSNPKIITHFQSAVTSPSHLPKNNALIQNTCLPSTPIASTDPTVTIGSNSAKATTVGIKF